MIILSENYRNRLKVLAGILSEVDYKFSEEEKKNAFIGFENRVKYNKDLMVKAIKEGWEVGILFWSKNEKYEMRTYKARTICPVALGLSKKGNPVLRAFHKVGQSESAGLKQRAAGEKNWRSAEAKMSGDFSRPQTFQGCGLREDSFRSMNSRIQRPVQDFPQGMTRG